MTDTNSTTGRPLAVALKAAKARAAKAQAAKARVADAEYKAAIEALASSDEPRLWDVYEDGYYATIEASSADEALEIALEDFDRSNRSTDEGTVWVDIHAHCILTDERSAEGRITIDPDEPACVDDGGHDWQGPYSIVGGIEENPGVRRHGGGVLIDECCMRCGCRRTMDTWAQNRSTGERGLHSISYEPGCYAEALDTR